MAAFPGWLTCRWPVEAQGPDGRTIKAVCGKEEEIDPLHIEVDSNQAMDLYLCTEHKEAWWELNRDVFLDAQPSDITNRQAVIIGGRRYYPNDIRSYLTDVLVNRPELLSMNEREMVGSITTTGKLNVLYEQLMVRVKMREVNETTPADDGFVDATPSHIFWYLRQTLKNHPDRLSISEQLKIDGITTKTKLDGDLLAIFQRLYQSWPSPMLGLARGEVSRGLASA